MKIYITGLPSGYEVEHLARLFYPMAPLTLTPPEPAEDCLWAEKTDTGLRVLVRQGEKSKMLEAPLPLPVEQGGETPEFALASLTYDLLRQWTGIRPPWGKMTGVRPVRLIHDKRAAGWSAEQIDRFFLQRFDCSEQKYAMAKEIADLQEPILQLGSAPKTYSLYIGIPFCPSRCSYCSFVSCNLDRDRKLVQPYVDCLCKEVAEIRVQAERAGLTLCSIYIGGGTPTSLSAAQLRQLMGTVRENFDLGKVVEYTVEAGRPDCTDAEKLAVIKEYGATRISINPQTFSDAVLANIGRKHSAQDILDCYADARRAGHEDINMDLIAGLPGDTVEGFEHSLRQAIALQPENITVHTLTLKRASRIVIEDQKENDYADVAAMLEKKGVSPIGKHLDRIRTKTLEQALSKHPLIDEVECYKTPSGKLCIEVTQRIPILRIMSANGENYYLDNKGTVMPPDAKCVAHRAIVTGNVEKSFAMRDLYKFGVFLQKNSFWNAQIEQIHVLPDKNIELVPRVGDHVIYLGKLDDFERKLKRVKVFYEKGLNKVGWNKYSRISVEFGNQIICTKRE